ncbi:Hpt domain-containing protein [Olleya aquimaris]|uniref:Hpt domain-containing protein n=1 Tax=Olleya sediminilitoris TaxID=2795739 RepID=A0ABS1WPH5_9FLAO|nr:MULTISPECIES: hypothetical protein [Olleya]AXO79900.1 Hpt domain-containing protein [Olleya aquimaris]MBL7561030.1 Hpt domain-containing protein [Olleya sediminilitoris]
MEQHYKLHRIKELADNDQDFILALASTFIEEVPGDAKVLEIAVNNENYLLAYQTAHKMKPTVDLFELGVLDDLIEVQDWGKFEQKDKDISEKLQIVLDAVDRTTKEIIQDFKL